MGSRAHEGEDILKGGTDFHTKLISHQNTYFDVTLEIGREELSITRSLLTHNLQLGHPLMFYSLVIALRLPCLRLLVGHGRRPRVPLVWWPL
jgi:hypothetical protein